MGGYWINEEAHCDLSTDKNLSGRTTDLVRVRLARMGFFIMEAASWCVAII